jgi:ABC-type glycerol-3-phosphate transport system substrate-binding protein
MMKKGFLSRLVAFIIVGAILISDIPSASLGFENKVKAVEASNLNIAQSWTLLDTTKIADKVEADSLTVVDETTAKHTNEGVLLSVDGSVQFTFNVPSADKYNLVLQYRVDSDKVLKNTVSISLGDKEALVSIPSLWKDSSKDYSKDRYGNDIIPEQKMVEGMHLEYVKEYASLDKSPFVLDLTQGQQTITLKNNTQPIVLNAVYLVKGNKVPSYKEYSDKLTDKTAGRDLITIEAENYDVKSDSFIRVGNVQNAALHPYSTNEKRLNIIEGASFKDAGQKILWNFEVPNSGMYSIGFSYAQNTKQGMSVFRNIEIDGNTPFQEMKDYPFQYTGLKFENLIVSDKAGQDLKVWLDKGKHTIAMEADAQPVEAIVLKLKDIMLQINSAGIDIKKLTGGKKDVNRTWDISEYMPDIVEKLEDWANELDKVYGQLEKISGKEPSFAVNLQVAAKNLRDIAKKPKEIPSNLTKLSEGSGSAAQLIGDLNLSLSQQPLSLDRVYIIGDGKLPSTSVNIFTSLWEGTKRFFSSFLAENKGYGGVSEEADELTVWVNRPIQYVELLQQLADADFTTKSGIKVKFSVMPNEQKLTLANASKKNPDVALGISNYIPYQLAIRGAVADLTQFKDFLPYISREYNLETLIPFTTDNKVYGVTETQDFYVLMYRKDILDKLNMSVPQTWDDVENMMPELQRHTMNFFVPMAAWSGLKPFYTTAPFLFQNGGTLYSKDGLTSAINTEQTIKGFELMTDLFNIYSVAENAPNFYNNFRYGTMPIGVSNFGTYVTLMNAAPEIAGLWEIAPSPGVKDKDGNIKRYQVGSDRSDVIFENSSNKEQSWEFLKWWLSKEVQIKYAYALQTKFGPEYMWNTANMAAFEELPFPEKDKKVILEQWKHIKEIPPHPASYMAEREISNAWTNIVMNGASIRTTLDKAAVTINREIKLKLEEFGYYKDGKVLREYQIPSVEDIRKQVKGSK